MERHFRPAGFAFSRTSWHFACAKVFVQMPLTEASGRENDSDD